MLYENVPANGSATALNSLTDYLSVPVSVTERICLFSFQVHCVKPSIAGAVQERIHVRKLANQNRFIFT